MLLLNPSCFHGYRYPSMGLLSMAAVLRQEGLPVEVIDANYDPRWREALAEKAESHGWVGITANVLSLRPALEAAEHVRKVAPGAKLLFGGPYPTVEYDRLPADAVCLGEGENTIVELAAGRPLSEIKGLAWRNNGGWVVNEQRDLIADLDALPMPAWDLEPVDKVRLPHTRRNPTLPVMTSRGCPHKCVFCGTAVITRRKVRLLSVDRVLDEMEYLVRVGAREIHFWDDNILIDPRRAAALCEGIIRRGFRDIPLASVSGIRPDTGDETLFRLMRRAGFYFICMAFETGDQDVMRQLGKPTDLSKAKATALAARRAGLTVNGFFMLGLPYDTEETMNRTVDFACSLPIDLALFFITIPFPGTRLYDMVVERGRFVYHRDDGMWEKGFFLGRATYDMPGQFDAETVERIYRGAVRRFFLRPRHILRLIRVRIRRPADLLHAIRRGWNVLTHGRQFK